MEAIVLAGGLGTRLQGVLNDVPKPMAPILGKPFLEYLLRYLHKNGVRRLVLSVSYKWIVIRDYFGFSFENIEIVYSVENEPLGTGGAIVKALDFCKSKEIFILNGDTFFDVSLNSLCLTNKSKLLLSLKCMENFDRYGFVESDNNGKITAFKEKGFNKSGNINGGVYLISNDLFDCFPVEERFSFEEFMMSNFIDLNATTKVFNDYFIDIGIPEDYIQAKIDFRVFYE
jgi:D-glycero-alpha-D-manno-heptose 1-phosphate guanylyltransferase